MLQTNEGRQKSTSQKLRSTPQNSVSNSAKSGTSTSQNLPTIINQLEISNKSYNSAPPTPLPAGGQSPAVLADRKKEAVAGIEQPKKSFGAPKKNWQPLSEQDFQQRKQSQIEALKKKI